MTGEGGVFDPGGCVGGTAFPIIRPLGPDNYRNGTKHPPILTRRNEREII